MRISTYTLLLPVILALFPVGAGAADKVDAPGAFNPIVPGYFASQALLK